MNPAVDAAGEPSPAQGPATGRSRHANFLPRRVVHLVGHVTAEVLSFLAPATQALAQDGVTQHVIVMKLDAGARRISKWGLAAGATVELLDPEAKPVLRWHRLAQALNRALASDRRAVLHLHGYVPALLGSLALMVARRRTPTVYSPHGSHVLQSALPFAALLRAVSPTSTSSIANHSFESSQLSGQTSAPVHLAECPLPPALLRLERAEGDRARVVAGALERAVQGVYETARMAVLLGDDGQGVQFEWMGALDDAGRAVLHAVGVPSFGNPEVAEPADHTPAQPQAGGAPFDAHTDAQTDADTDADADACLARLAGAWVHLAPVPVTHFPVLLVQAMALGLPCVALDVPYHRALIRHGETGFLCQTAHDMLHWTATLVQSPTLRAQVGAAAREHARARFGEEQFRHALLAAYTASVAHHAVRGVVVAPRAAWVSDAGMTR